MLKKAGCAKHHSVLDRKDREVILSVSISERSGDRDGNKCVLKVRRLAPEPASGIRFQDYDNKEKKNTLNLPGVSSRSGGGCV